MDPTTTCGPHPACPARGQGGQGTIGLHSRQDKRFIGTECDKTFSATKGTACSRLRTPAETIALVLTLLAHGCPLQAIVGAVGCDERTVAAWEARAGRQGQAGQAPLVEQPRALGHVQAEESRVKTHGGLVWMARALRVSTRLGRAGEGSAPRDRPLIRRRIARVRACALPRPLLCCTDGWCSSGRAMRETWRDPVPPGAPGRPAMRPWRHGCIAQVVQRYVWRRVVAVERRLVEGTPARVETLRRRSQGDGGINTASRERLHATFRERLASLTRRGRARARRTVTWQHGMSLIGTVENFCTPHASLRAAGATTPAMAAGITDHGWRVHALLSYHVPPPRWTPPKHRGRPSPMCKRLIERWGGDHG